MAENEGLDLSKVVNLIMENPRLIEEISSLVKKEETKEDLPTPNDSATESAAEAEEIKKSGITYENRGPKSSGITFELKAAFDFI